MEDEVSKQLDQVQKDIAALEQRMVLRDAPDRDAITRLKEERLAYSSQISSASQAEAMLELTLRNAAKPVQLRDGLSGTPRNSTPAALHATLLAMFAEAR